LRKNSASELAALSGGKYANFTTQKGFDAELQRISNEIHNYYLLSYKPPADPGWSLHAVRVRVPDYSDAVIQTRKSYGQECWSRASILHLRNWGFEYTGPCEGYAMLMLSGFLFGLGMWFVVRCVLIGIYTVDQNERAVKTVFGRAQRVGKTTLDDPIAEGLRPEERDRYVYPQVRVIPPGGPYFKMPWEKIYKISIATTTMNMAVDLEDPTANNAGAILEAVTKDQLNTGLTGQIRYRVSEANLYAYLFGIKKPMVHVMAYFVSVLRQKIASFEAKPLPVSAEDPEKGTAVMGISINDLRKNLRDLNEYMDQECVSTQARYGVLFDASLITGIDPPAEVESALAAINTAYNQVSSDISLAHAGADQKIVQSRRAVEIETLKAQAEVEPLRMMALELADLKRQGPNVLAVYVRNVKLALLSKAQQIFSGPQSGARS
jgi:regulator of protease activity HflC (stomatin/prohibitin superfamily)